MELTINQFSIKEQWKFYFVGKDKVWAKSETVNFIIYGHVYDSAHPVAIQTYQIIFIFYRYYEGGSNITRILFFSKSQRKDSLLFGAQFPNSAFAETGPRVQCAAGFPHWEFVSISAVCRLQGAGPDLLPMVVLAGLRVRRPWII